MSLNEQQQKDLKILENHLQEVQAFVDENIINKNKAMASSLIWKGLANTIPDMDEGSFKRSFSLNVKVGNIKGIYGAKRAGFKPLDSNNEIITEDNDTLPAPPPIDEEEKISIRISKSTRLYGVDKRNWAFQKLQQVNEGHVWLSTHYWPNLSSALKGVAGLLLDKEIKNSKLEISDIKNIIDYITEAENRIYNQMQSVINESVKEETLEDVA